MKLIITDTITNIIKIIFKVVIPALYIVATIIKWDQNDICLDRTLFCICIILSIGIDKVLTLYRFYLKETAYEYEITILLILVKVINKLENENIKKMYPTTFDKIAYYFFDSILIANIICYAFAFIIIFIYSITLLVALIRGDPSLNPSRGLTNEEFLNLNHIKYRDFQNKKTDDTCPICLLDYEDDDNIVILPNCNHYTHDTCLNAWVLEQPICPFCRNNILLSLYQ